MAGRIVEVGRIGRRAVKKGVAVELLVELCDGHKRGRIWRSDVGDGR